MITGGLFLLAHAKHGVAANILVVEGTEMHKVILFSDMYGGEEFTYDSFEEAMAGLRRLATEAIDCVARDGLEREVTFVASPETNEEQLGECFFRT